MLPYKSKAGETRVKSLRNTLKSVIPANNTSKFIFTGTKLASKFNIKNEINKKICVPNLNVMRYIYRKGREEIFRTHCRPF